MSELITMTELTDTELDAVCGGSILDWGNAISQSNSANQTVMNVLGFSGNTTQNLTQTNVAHIGDTLFTLPIGVAG